MTPWDELYRRLLGQSEELRKQLISAGAGITAAESSVNKLLDEIENPEQYNNMRLAESALVKIAVECHEIAGPIILERLERDKKNPDVAMSIINILGTIGPKSKEVTAKLLDIASHRTRGGNKTEIGAYASRMFQDHYGTSVSVLVNGFLYLTVEQKKDGRNALGFLVEHLLYLRSIVGLKEAEVAVEGTWRIMGNRKEQDEMLWLKGVIEEYARASEIPSVKSQTERGDYEEIRDEEALALLERRKIDREIVKFAREHLLNFLNRVADNDNRELEKILDFDKFDVALRVSMMWFRENGLETISTLTKLLGRRKDILGHCKSESRKDFRASLRMLKEFLASDEVKQFLPESRKMGTGREEGEVCDFRQVMRNNAYPRFCRTSQMQQRGMEQKLRML